MRRAVAVVVAVSVSVRVCARVTCTERFVVVSEEEERKKARTFFSCHLLLVETLFFLFSLFISHPVILTP